MKRKQIWRFVLLVCASAVAECYAASSEGEYQVITQKNVFRLKQPPEQRADEMITPLPKFRLTGITTFGGKRAFVTMQTPARPGERPEEHSLILRQGRLEREVEVLAIDEKHGIVEIRCSGRRLKLEFEEEHSSRFQFTRPAEARKPVGA